MLTMEFETIMLCLRNDKTKQKKDSAERVMAKMRKKKEIFILPKQIFSNLELER